MGGVTLAQAHDIISAALDEGARRNLAPLAVVVLDDRGSDKALAAQDGASLKRVQLARGKAHGAMALGTGSRSLYKRAREQPAFIAAAGQIIGEPGLLPVPGGVLIRDEDGKILGAVGISGDASDNDEAAAIAGIAATGLRADPGAD